MNLAAGDSMANMMVMAMDKDHWWPSEIRSNLGPWWPWTPACARSEDKDGVLSKEEIASVPLGDQGDMNGKAEVRSESYLIHSAVISKKPETSRDIPGTSGCSRYLKQCVMRTWSTLVNCETNLAPGDVLTNGSGWRRWGQPNLRGSCAALADVLSLLESLIKILIDR